MIIYIPSAPAVWEQCCEISLGGCWKTNQILHWWTIVYRLGPIGSRHGWLVVSGQYWIHHVWMVMKSLWLIASLERAGLWNGLELRVDVVSQISENVFSIYFFFRGVFKKLFSLALAYINTFVLCKAVLGVFFMSDISLLPKRIFTWMY